jgi:hypothetical protein
LIGILAAGAMLVLMVWAGSIVTLTVIVSVFAVLGFKVGWRVADHVEASLWTAQRCWEILGDDRHPPEVQELAAVRLARLGRNVVADPVGWWPWRAAIWRTAPGPADWQQSAGRMRRSP